MKKIFFGTDGIRGVANKFPIVPEFLFNLAIGISKLKKKKITKVLFGRDTRISGKNIEDALFQGFSSIGVECQSIGIVSTPMVSFYTKKFKCDYGIMISASHNPYKDNGVKIFKKNGEKLSDEEEIIIEKNLNLKTKVNLTKESIKKKEINFEDYNNFVLKNFSNKINLNGLKIFIDCANGSLSKIAPKFFSKLGATIISSGCSPNGKNINRKCGAMFPEKLSESTKKFNADIGLSFDGDADRVLISDEQGKILDGDDILSAISTFLKKKKMLTNNSIVTTDMSNLGFREFIKKKKIRLYVSKVGDRYVIKKMKETKSILGGEQSGHIIFSKNGFCGDGILTSLFIINISLNNMCKVSQIADLFNKFPQELINIKLKGDAESILNNSKFKKLLKNFVNNLNSHILVRKSGTENLLRLMVQSKEKLEKKKIIDSLLFEIRNIDEKLK